MKRIMSLCVLWLVCVYESPIVYASAWWKLMIIKGQVIEEKTKAPLLAELSISVGVFSPVKLMTDSTGKFVATIPEASQCTIYVTSPGFEAKTENVSISSSTITDNIEIPLVPLIKLTLDGTVFGGVVNDEQPIDARVNVYLNSDYIKTDSSVVLQGKYTESFSNFGWYIIEFSAPGFVDAVDTIWVMNNQRKRLHKDYHLIPLDSKMPVALANILFKFGSSTLPTGAYVELDYISDFLSHNPSQQIGISGHTDNTGPSEYNVLLSQARAKSVVSYMMTKGVKASQLITAGYGENVPIDSNATQFGKTNNRRVELTLINK